MSVAAACVRGVCVCLLPREDNHDRPLILRHKSLSLLSALLIAIKVATIGLIALTPTQADLSTITVNRIIQLTNAERKKAGVGELKTNGKLMAAAQLKGEDMLAHDYFAHISPTGVTPWFWMAKTGYTYQVAGENLAIDFTEAEDVVSAWLASPSHHDNMLRSDYTETGVAVVSGEFEGGTSIIVVHMFGKPSSSQVAAGVSVSPTPTPTPAPVKLSSTPGPSATPTPTPTVIPPTNPELPPDTTPPRVPRISTPDGSTTVQERVQLFLEGDSDSTVHMLVNTTEEAATTLSKTGKAIFALDVSSFEDGALSLQGYATDAASNKSELSEPLELTKDTQAPEASREEVVFLVSPITESSNIAIYVPLGDSVRLAISQKNESLRATYGDWTHIPIYSEPITISFADAAGNTKLLPNIDIKPQFTVDETASENAFELPQQFSAWGRTFTMSALIAILFLLITAVFIRVRIQHPDLITHASFVILLAGILLVL